MSASRSIGVFTLAAAGGLCLLLASPSASAQAPKASKESIEHGKYIIKTSGCGDCHSPKVMGPQGPVEHPTLALSGHPAASKVPEVPAGVLGPGKWGALASDDLTAWAGPWGVSFAANLTPDPATGIGSWTEKMFIDALRTGKHLGAGRPILPPMPWPQFAQKTDQDLKDMFAYLMSLKPVVNQVPEPIPPKK
jgi:mono/diheme cytochrome c family protein